MSLGSAAPESRRGRRPRAVCGFVPPYLLHHIVGAGGAGPTAADSETARCAASTLVLDRRLRTEREQPPAATPATVDGVGWSVHSADHSTQLPGTRVRSEGEPSTGDPAVDEAAVGGSGALALFADVYGRNSYDDAGATVVMTVHYGREYNNAFWNGRQLVFGDGDGRVFDRFTKPVDVLGHELTHAVTEYSAGLVYRNQPGALNESMSDVFASCAKQRMLGQTVLDADWLIGAGLFLPGVHARALRDMAAPGTAYDDPVIGRDPQVGHMDDYVRTTDDNGGVHLNSGIPNRAFHLAATAIGGASWDGAGAIWYAALASPDVGPTTGFTGFADVTVALAGEHSDTVREAWTTVGVLGAAAADGPGGAPMTGGLAVSGALVRVRRTGGFAGLSSEGSLDLAGDDPRAAEVSVLVRRVDLVATAGAQSHPDEFTYSVALPGSPPVVVPEQAVTGDLRRLVELVLGEGA